MSRAGGRPRTTERKGPRSFFHYLEIVRERWVSAALAFGVTAAIVAAFALFATPVYESQALVQVEMNRGGTADELAQIAMVDAGANIEAELEVITSYRIAEDAARIAGAGVHIYQPNVYRPWESLLRRFRGEDEPPRLHAHLVTRPMPARDTDVRLTFTERGTSFTVEDLATGQLVATHQYDRREGTLLHVGDMHLLIKSTTGAAPRNAQYVVCLRCNTSADQDVKGEPAKDVEGAVVNPDLRVSTELRTMPVTTGQYAVRITNDGTRIEVRENGSTEVLQDEPWDAAKGARIQLGEDHVEVRPVAGIPAGHTYTLELKSARLAAQWVQAAAIASQRGDWTGLINVGARTNDPYLARQVADALAASYLKRKEGRKNQQILRRLEWLKDELKESRKDLESALNARNDYIIKSKAVLLSEKATSALQAKRDLFEQRLIQQELRDRTQATLEALESTSSPEQILAIVGDSDVDVQTQAMANRVVQLRMDRGKKLRIRSTAEDLTVKEIDAEIAEIEKELDRRSKVLLAEVKADLERRIAATDERLKRIEEQDKKHQETLDALPDTERELGEKTLAVEAARQRLVFLEQRRGESELALTSTMTNASLVDDAVLDTARKSPVLFRQAIVAIFLGLLAGVGTALVRHLRDRSVQSPGDIEEHVDLPVLATVPDFSSVPRRQRKGLTASLPVFEIPSSTLAENYRTLRANIRFADTPKRVQAMTMTSAVPSEGKTVSTLNLALAMAAAGNSVLVVDADLRRPMVDTHLEGQRSPGLTEVLQGKLAWREAVQDYRDSGLRFIAAGSTHPNPSSLMEGDLFDSLLAEWRAAFDYILFDVPPVLAVADAAGFFSQLDAVLIVSRQGACPIDIVRGAREQVERFGGTVIGAVYNGFDAKRAGSRRYGYGSYHGYYGYYGSHGYYGRSSDNGAEAAKPEKKSRGASTEVS